MKLPEVSIVEQRCEIRQRSPQRIDDVGLFCFVEIAACRDVRGNEPYAIVLIELRVAVSGWNKVINAHESFVAHRPR